MPFLSILQKSRSNSKYPLGINLANPGYILYMAAHFENAEKMEDIVQIINTCPSGKTLNAETLSVEKGLPKYVIRAVFKLYLKFCKMQYLWSNSTDGCEKSTVV